MILNLSDDVPGGTEDSRLHYLWAPGEPGVGAELGLGAISQ